MSYQLVLKLFGVNPNTVKAMDEVGIDIRNQTSDSIDNKFLNSADLVVTLCGHANDVCPVTPSHVKRVNWGFDDPAGQEWIIFQTVRDQIGERIKVFLKRVNNVQK